jgi:hypothetical protein
MRGLSSTWRVVVDPTNEESMGSDVAAFRSLAVHGTLFGKFHELLQPMTMQSTRNRSTMVGHQRRCKMDIMTSVGVGTHNRQRRRIWNFITWLASLKSIASNEILLIELQNLKDVHNIKLYQFRDNHWLASNTISATHDILFLMIFLFEC